MSITIVAIVTSSAGNQTIDVTGKGLVAGDVIIACEQTPGHRDGSTWPNHVYSSFADPDPNITRQAYLDNGGTTNWQGWIYTILYDGTANVFHFEPLFATGHVVAYACRGVDNTAPYDSASWALGTTASPNSGSGVTPANDNSLLLWFIGANAAISAGPSGYAINLDGSTYVEDNPFGAYSLLQTTATATGTVSATMGGSADWLAVIVAIKAASGGGGGGINVGGITYVTS